MINIKWFPPSWVQIQAESQFIYFDPAYLSTYFAHYPKRIEYSKWPDPIDGLPEKLEKGDVILITHHHKDHCKKVTVNRLRKGGTEILATRQCIKELGADITLVQPGMQINIGAITVQIVDAYNIMQEGQKKLVHKKGNGVGYVITVEGKRIYHAGDTDLIPEMKQIEDIDVALLPIGGRDFTMGLNEAVQAAKNINPKAIIPMHRFESDPKEYKRMVETDTSIKVAPLGIGETYQL